MFAGEFKLGAQRLVKWIPGQQLTILLTTQVDKPLKVLALDLDVDNANMVLTKSCQVRKNKKAKFVY
jgi:hypothetical protein